MYSHEYAKWSHSKKRYFERYGAEISERDLSEIKKFVRLSEPKSGLNYYEIIFNGDLLKLIYEPESKEISTFLPKDYQPRDENLSDIFKDRAKNNESIYKVPNFFKLKLYIKAKNTKTKNVFHWGAVFEKSKLINFINEPDVQKLYDQYINVNTTNQKSHHSTPE